MAYFELLKMICYIIITFIKGLLTILVVAAVAALIAVATIVIAEKRGRR